MNKREFVERAVQLLAQTKKDWAQLYVTLRSEFFHTYNREKLISSTLHGAEFFENVLFVMNGGEWEEKGEYGKNFRRLCLTD